MKKLSIILVFAAFAWSIPACTNRNNNDQRTDERINGDDGNNDTVVTPPPDTPNQMPDTTL